MQMILSHVGISHFEAECHYDNKTKSKFYIPCSAISTVEVFDETVLIETITGKNYFLELEPGSAVNLEATKHQIHLAFSPYLR